mgnify:FL=1
MFYRTTPMECVPTSGHKLVDDALKLEQQWVNELAVHAMVTSSIA